MGVLDEGNGIPTSFAKPLGWVAEMTKDWRHPLRPDPNRPNNLSPLAAAIANESGTGALPEIETGIGPPFHAGYCTESFNGTHYYVCEFCSDQHHSTAYTPMRTYWRSWYRCTGRKETPVHPNEHVDPDRRVAFRHNLERDRTLPPIQRVNRDAQKHRNFPRVG